MQITDDTLILSMMLAPDTRNKGYRELVNKHKEKLYWHIRRIVLFHEDADDVLQNTFIKIVRNIEKFEGQSSLFTWMYKIATNESLNYIKSKKTRPSESIENTMYFTKSADISIEENKVLNLLQKAIDTLPEKQKLVFNMRYYNEMPYHEMSEITDTSVGALKASYHHAVKKIEEIIKKES